MKKLLRMSDKLGALQTLRLEMKLMKFEPGA